MDDYISRQMALDELNQQIRQCDKALADINISMKDEYAVTVERASLKAYKEQLEHLPAAPELTLYGYKIEHLAYIARVMQKEGVTAEYAARTFDDMSRALKMIIDEAREAVEKQLEEIYG